jgi:hypothetical protein
MNDKESDFMARETDERFELNPASTPLSVHAALSTRLKARLEL